MHNVKLLTMLGIGLLVAPYAKAQYGGQADPDYGNQGYQDQGNGNPNPQYSNPNQGYPDQGYGNPNPQYSNPNQGYPDQGYGGQAYVDPGPPPTCSYGYFPTYPYACAPYGYYGPSWFSVASLLASDLGGAGMDSGSTGDGATDGGVTMEAREPFLEAERIAVGTAMHTPDVATAAMGVPIAGVASVEAPGVSAAVVPTGEADTATLGVDIASVAVDMATAGAEAATAEAVTVVGTGRFRESPKLSRPTALAVGRLVFGAVPCLPPAGPASCYRLRWPELREGINLLRSSRDANSWKLRTSSSLAPLGGEGGPQAGG